MSEKSKYYVIIPADIRYDSRLKANEKLMYGELVLLSQETGYCWATNAYFANLYNVTKITVSNWISTLEECGYITIEYIYKEGTKEILERRIRICDNTVSKAQEKLADIEPVEEENTYTKQKDLNEKVEEVISYLNKKCETKFKSNTSITKKLIKKRLNEGFDLNDFKKVVDLKWLDWGEHPVRFSNGQMSNEFLRPVTLFGDKFESYVYEAIIREQSEGLVSNSFSEVKEVDEDVSDYVF